MNTGNHGLYGQKLKSGECCLNSAAEGKSELRFMKCWRLYVDKSYANKFDNLDESYLQTQHNTYKISTTFFQKWKSWFSNLYEIAKGAQIVKTISKKKNLKDSHTYQFQNLLQSYGNQNSVVLENLRIDIY